MQLNRTPQAPVVGPFSRRTMLIAAVGAPLLAMVAAACGDPSTEPATTEPPSTDGGSVPGTAAPGAFTYPTGADDAVIRFGFEGGFVPVGVAFVNLPNLIVSGDGRAFSPAAITLEYPGPLVMPMTVRTITDTGIQALLVAADTAGLLATPPSYEAPTNVADAPNTVVALTTDAGTFVHSAYALGFGTDEQGNPVEESSPERAALYDYAQLLGNLEAAVGADQLGAEEMFEPAEYRLQALPIAEADLAGMDPAPTIVDWPASTGLDLATAAECARLSSAAAGTLFADARSNTYFRQGDTLYALSVAGVLPGDPAC